jgi:hypothetical protein
MRAPPGRQHGTTTGRARDLQHRTTNGRIGDRLERREQLLLLRREADRGGRTIQLLDEIRDVAFPRRAEDEAGILASDLREAKAPAHVERLRARAHRPREMARFNVQRGRERPHRREDFRHRRSNALNVMAVGDYHDDANIYKYTHDVKT